MKTTLATEYAQEQAIRHQYDTAKTANDVNAVEAARKTYNDFAAGIENKGKVYARIYRMYSDAQKRGNTYIDLNDAIWDSQVTPIIDSLRECGIEKFTFSSSWSSAVETAWLFLQNGCHLEGLVEINGPYEDFINGGYQKAHGYLFSL